MAGSIALASLVLFYPEPGAGFTPIPPDEIGWFSQYAQQPTDMMIAYHGFDFGLAYIAVSDCGRIGDWALITVDDSAPFMARVYDCAGSVETVEWMQTNYIVGEIDSYTAARFGVTGRGGVRGSIRWIDG